MVVSGPKGVRYVYLMINIIHLLYSQNFLLDINFAQPSNLALQKCGKDHHTLYAIINVGKKIAGKKIHSQEQLCTARDVCLHAYAIDSCAKLCSTYYIDSMLKY